MDQNAFEAIYISKYDILDLTNQQHGRCIPVLIDISQLAVELIDCCLAFMQCAYTNSLPRFRSDDLTINQR